MSRWALLLLLLCTIGSAQETAEPTGETESAPAESILDQGFETDLFARDTYRLDTVICPFKNDIEYKPGEIECSLLEVPENRENPDSRFIELHVVKLHSSWGREKDEEEETAENDQPKIELAPGKRDDPIIYLTGGPGARATYYVGRLKDHTVLEHRDVYILEQRGIGYSDDFCPLYGTRNPPETLQSFDEYVFGAAEDMTDCAERAEAAGVDLDGYNTIENARDVRALREALGLENWNVWGISYGSILGQAYIKEDPQGIRAVALDAIVPLDVRSDPMHWRVVNWYNRDLEKLDALCQADAACAEHYPNLGQRVRDAAKTLIDNPIEVEVKDTELHPSGRARVYSDIAAFLPFIFFYEQSNYPGLPGIIYAWADAVEARDETVFKALAQAGGDFISGSQGMANAILCTDGDLLAQAIASKKDMEEFPVLAQLGTAESLDREAALCAELGMAPRPEEDYSPVVTDIPSLIIEGDMDPITPPPLAKAILPGFSNGTYVEFPYAGHGPSRSVECAGPMLNKFYDDPTAEPDLSCVDTMEPPEFIAPLYRTSLVPELMLIYLEEKKTLARPALWAGASALVSLIAFVVLTLAPILRFMDRRKADATMGARTAAWFAALLSVTALGIFGAAGGATYETVEALPAFGLVPWAAYGAYSGVAAGLMGLLTIALTFRTRGITHPRHSSVLGFLITGTAAVSLSAFFLVWGLGPF